MELLDRYLEAVKKHLPWQRQDDIIAELRANLESQLEEKEAELGRPLTSAEAEEWIKQLGAPLQMAARFKPQQYLIGPTVFPIYTTVLKIAVTWAMIIYSIASVALICTGTPSLSAVVEALVRVPGILMTTAAWVTLIFAALEFAVAQNYIKFPAMVAPSAGWSPGALPPLQMDTTNGKKPRSFAQAVAEAVFSFLLLIWLLLLPKHPWLLFGPGAAFLDTWDGHPSPFQLAPVWVQFYWWVVAPSVLQVGWRCVDLLRGTWQKRRPILHLVMRSVGLIPLLLLLTVRDHALVLLKNPALDQARYGVTVDAMNRGANIVLSFICAIAVLQLAWDLGKMSLNAWRKREAAMQ
jgi:hypothetical protein